MKSRRDAFRKLFFSSVAVSALPSTWVKPVLTSVILPAHAQTSSPTITLVSVGEFNAYGVELTFIEAQSVASDSALKFLITFDASIDQSEVGGPGVDLDRRINIEGAALLSSINGSSVFIGGNTDFSECSGAPLVYIPQGRNVIELEFSDLVDTNFTDFNFSIYDQFCGLRPLGRMRFELNFN